MAIPGVLTTSAMNDVNKSTLKELTRLRYVDIAPTLTKYTGMRSLFQKNRVEVIGSGIQWDVNVTDPDAASNVGFGATDVVDIGEGWVEATAPWRNSMTYYAIIGQEESMNADNYTRIQDLKKARRDRAVKSLAYLMEANWWGAPVALSDELTPYGINTWIVKNATAGFNGGAPSGWTTIGGLNPTTYGGWKNYTALYTLLSKPDGIRAWRLAAYATDFQPPIDGIPTTNTGNDYGFYMNRSTVMTLEELLEAQNDDLGSDVDSQYNRPVFRSQPCDYVPFLDADTTNPIYGINWGDFKTYILQGWWLKETHVPIYPDQHTVKAWFIDLTYQIVCRNRRLNFVLATAATYPS